MAALTPPPATLTDTVGGQRGGSRSTGVGLAEQRARAGQPPAAAAPAGVEDEQCGHVIVEGLAGLEHHDIPDDGAPHVPSSECGCTPQRYLVHGHTVIEHLDQDRDDEYLG